jgi:hypothetical protein
VDVLEPFAGFRLTTALTAGSKFRLSASIPRLPFGYDAG